MSDETIPPALTPEEWKERTATRGQWHDAVEVTGFDTIVVVRGGAESVFPTPARHALAALCLYQQPFGFTQEDVAMLRSPWTHPDELASLAARISALLPPEAQ